MVYLNLFFACLETVVTEFCIYWFLSHNDRTRFLNKAWYVVMFSLGGILLFLSSGFTGTKGWSTVLCLFLEVLLFGILGFHRRIGAIAWDFLFMLFLFLLMELGIFLSQYLARGMWNGNYIALGNFIMFVKCILMLFGTFGLTAWRERMKKGRLPSKQLLLLFVFPVLSLILFVTIIEMSYLYAQLYGIGILLADTAVLVFMNIYFFFLLRYLYRSKELEQEMEVSRRQNEIQYQYYGKLEKRYLESRKILHDMKNHLQAVERIYHEEDRERGDQYVKDLYHMLNVLGEKYYVPDRLLNIILNEKLDEAMKKGVEVKTEIGEVAFGDMKDIDITTIFANLLDNAVEASSRAEKKYLSIKMDEVRDFRVISLWNSCPEKEKKEPRHQGLGLGNVSQTLSKYHGTLQTEKVGTEFRVNIMLPREEKCL